MFLLQTYFCSKKFTCLFRIFLGYFITLKTPRRFQQVTKHKKALILIFLYSPFQNMYLYLIKILVYDHYAMFFTKLKKKTNIWCKINVHFFLCLNCTRTWIEFADHQHKTISNNQDLWQAINDIDIVILKFVKLVIEVNVKGVITHSNS